MLTRNLKLHKNECRIMSTRIKFFKDIIQPGPEKLNMLTKIINHIGKHLPSTAKLCKPLRKLTSLKWEWNGKTHTKAHISKPKPSSKRMQHDIQK